MAIRRICGHSSVLPPQRWTIRIWAKGKFDTRDWWQIKTIASNSVSLRIFTWNITKVTQGDRGGGEKDTATCREQKNTCWLNFSQAKSALRVRTPQLAAWIHNSPGQMEADWKAIRSTWPCKTASAQLKIPPVCQGGDSEGKSALINLSPVTSVIGSSS